MQKIPQKNSVLRPPVIVIMGHIDHGKSTLLDYIRKSNIVSGEAGGITQHIGAYEVAHTDQSGKPHTITFLDTPGHEAFQGIRTRSASVADIAVLVVSAEDGVKPQTLEALSCILKSGIPYIVAINKIDKPEADIERTKQSMAEHEIYVEEYGGTIPCVPISAKTGQGIPELLDMMLLVAELAELKADPNGKPEGIVIEADRDTRKGISATVIIKNGTLKTGECIVSEESFSPLRSLENFLGKKVVSAGPGQAVKIIGWNSLPRIGASFSVVATKKEAEAQIEILKNKVREEKGKKAVPVVSGEKVFISLVIKADTSGSLEAINHEMKKLARENIEFRSLLQGVGPLSENDVKTGSGTKDTFVLGFNVKIDPQAKASAERLGIEIKTFTIIYDLVKWLDEIAILKTPRLLVEEMTGKAKVLKIFSKDKDKQIIGGRVEIGTLLSGAVIKILRRDNEIGQGKIRGLQKEKIKTEEVAKDTEFGAMVESKIEIVPGDRLESFTTVQK